MLNDTQHRAAIRSSPVSPVGSVQCGGSWQWHSLLTCLPCMSTEEGRYSFLRKSFDVPQDESLQTLCDGGCEGDRPEATELACGRPFGYGDNGGRNEADWDRSLCQREDENNGEDL